MDIFSLASISASKNPYPIYKRLRSKEPVHWDALAQGWHVTDYVTVNNLLRDRRLSAIRQLPKREASTLEVRQIMEPLDHCYKWWLTFREPPDHTKFRRVCNKEFTPNLVQLMAQPVKAAINKLLDEIPAGKPFDLMRCLAHPLPIVTVGNMLGLRSSDLDLMTGWTSDIVEAFGTGLLTIKSAKSYHSAVACLERILSQTEGNTLSTIMAHFANAKDQGIVTHEELLSNLVFLLLAGHDTTTNLIGNSIYSLIRHPAEFEKLRSAPSLASSAIEELLRFESPIQYVSRTATEQIEINKKVIQPGQQVFLSIGGANRDPNQFADPDILDIQRHPNHHLAFITGVHFCLGASLAKLEGCLVLESLMNRFRCIEAIDNKGEWKSDAAVRGLRHLQIIGT